MSEFSGVVFAGLDDTQRALLQLTWELLDAIHNGDVDTYAALCTADLSCFEDVCSYRIDGVEFHLTLMHLMTKSPENKPARFDMLSPRVQVYGDTGIVTYTRLMTYESGGSARFSTFNETRVYVRLEGSWKMAHFHRSLT